MHFMIGLAIFVMLIACFPRIMLGLGAAALIALLWLTAGRPSDGAGGGAGAPTPTRSAQPPAAPPAAEREDATPANREPTPRPHTAPRLVEPPRLPAPRLRFFFIP